MPGAILIKKALQIFRRAKKYRRARPCDIFHYVRLVSGADSAVGAGIRAGTAIQASASVDHVLRIALGDSAHGASVCASAAADASGTDLISHFEYLH